MAIAKVGAALTGNTGATTVSSQNVAITPTAGNAIVVCCSIRSGSGTLSGISATGGTATFVSRVAESTAGSAALAIWTAHNVGAGITQITLTPATSARALVWWVQEYSGVELTLDVTSIGAAPGSSASQSSPSITPVTLGAVVIAANANAGVASTASPFSDITAGPTTHSGTTAGAGWTSEFSQWNDSSTGLDLTVASNVVNALGAYECDWTIAAAAQSGNGAIVLRPSITPAAGSLVLTGGTPVLTVTIPPAGASLGLTGGTPQLQSTIPPAGASAALSGGTPQLQTVLPPTAATLTLTASTPVLQTSIPPGGATLTLSGGAPAVTLTITPSGATATLSGGTPELEAVLPPAGASLALTGAAPVLGTTIAPSGASLALIGATPGVTITDDLVLNPAGGSLTLTGSTPALAEEIQPGSASLALTGSTPSLSVVLTPAAAALLMTGATPQLVMPVTLTPAGVALALTGETPVVIVTTMAVTPPNRVITVHSENRTVSVPLDERTFPVPTENRTIKVGSSC